jgi:hypothetical protein
MHCTNCNQRIEPGQPYHRTKSGRHHRACSALAQAPAFDLWWKQNEWPIQVGIRREDAEKIFSAGAQSGSNDQAHSRRPAND